MHGFCGTPGDLLTPLMFVPRSLKLPLESGLLLPFVSRRLLGVRRRRQILPWCAGSVGSTKWHLDTPNSLPPMGKPCGNAPLAAVGKAPRTEPCMIEYDRI